ncbi:hypothetical protein AVEN_204971-1 [Araneus ventricosus]|uniref:Uncharacterized protein n=1 Tax=Araneus ventricosus TaxID=182803 RepID=A0A4Y2NUJ2_ARAVE|nr:hypothetical protein AVEN_204971-1 [Araneus ventricosus]
MALAPRKPTQPAKQPFQQNASRVLLDDIWKERSTLKGWIFFCRPPHTLNCNPYTQLHHSGLDLFQNGKLNNTLRQQIGNGCRPQTPPLAKDSENVSPFPAIIPGKGGQ